MTGHLLQPAVAGAPLPAWHPVVSWATGFRVDDTHKGEDGGGGHGDLPGLRRALVGQSPRSCTSTGRRCATCQPLPAPQMLERLPDRAARSTRRTSATQEGRRRIFDEFLLLQIALLRRRARRRRERAAAALDGGPHGALAGNRSVHAHRRSALRDGRDRRGRRRRTADAAAAMGEVGSGKTVHHALRDAARGASRAPRPR